MAANPGYYLLDIYEHETEAAKLWKSRRRRDRYWSEGGIRLRYQGAELLPFGAVDDLSALWAVANLSWVGVAWLFLRLHRLTQWNQQVLSALKAAMDEAEVVRALGRDVLADLAHTRGIPRRDRAWVSSMLAALTPPDHDDTAGTQEQQWHPGAAMKEPDENEMNNDAHTGASPTGAAEPGIREVVRDLTGHLGPTLVAVMAGSQDPGIAVQWAGDDGLAPDPPAESKLRLAHRVWAGLSAAEGDEVARLWFLGTNPWLDGISPVEAIAQGRAQAVLGAARAMIEDRHAG